MLFDFNNFDVIDLSLPIDENMSYEPFPVRISRIGHKEGIKYLNKAMLLKGKGPINKKIKQYYKYYIKNERIEKNAFPDKEFLSEEKVFSSVHTGTHVDASFHFGTKCEKRESKYISDIELKYFIGQGVVLDVSSVLPGSEIKIRDVKNACEKINHKFSKGDIVLIKTGASKYWGQKEYFFKFPGMSREATQYILSHGIKLIGIDALGFDRPYGLMVKDYLKNRNAEVLWPAHFLGREKEYYHIERLNNLDEIPNPTKFIFCGFPIKILNVGAAWIRAVALIEKKKDKK